MPQELYIGLMSGTSMDGVDGVVIDLAPGAGFKILAHQHQAFAPTLKAALFSLNKPGADELHRAALAGNAIARAYAEVVAALLAASNLPAQAVSAIGAHGQTVRHRPGEFDGTGYTSQLLNAALLAELTGIDVVADLRSRDVAAGGQGAPLVPAFHHAAFAQPGRDIAVLNLGGIANITFLPADGRVSGFDCGPANVLMDLWALRHTGQAFDADGAWARQGAVDTRLLGLLLQDAYLHRTPPKSTGRDRFHAEWLDQQLAVHQSSCGPIKPQDVQHTLARYSARIATDDLRRTMPQASQLLVCGGGARNAFLMQCLGDALPQVQVRRIDQVCALDPMHIEAAAFGWLAQGFCHRRTANLPAVTGAGGARVLGALYPA